MAVLLFLNELSCIAPDRPGDSGREATRVLLNDFVKLLMDIQRRRRDVALVSAAPIHEVGLGPDYSFAHWAADNRNRDYFRRLQAMRNRAPFHVVGTISETGSIVYLLDGQAAIGLGYAHTFGGMGVSIRTGDRWETAEINLARQELVENDEDDLHLGETSVSIRHAARFDHIDSHDIWLSTAGSEQLRTPRLLWEARADMFPNLDFLSRVEADLQSLGPVHLRQVTDHLVKLEQATRRWDPARSSAPAWQSKVTPEAEQRRRLCQFEDLDGVHRIFDLHARFTPGPGRIHFRINAKTKKIIIAYIGRKIS